MPADVAQSHALFLQVAEQMGDRVRILKVDTDQNPEISSQLQVPGRDTYHVEFDNACHSHKLFKQKWCLCCPFKLLDTLLIPCVKKLRLHQHQQSILILQCQIQGLPTLIFVGLSKGRPALRTEGLLPANVIQVGSTMDNAGWALNCAHMPICKLIIKPIARLIVRCTLPLKCTRSATFSCNYLLVSIGAGDCGKWSWGASSPDLRSALCAASFCTMQSSTSCNLALPNLITCFRKCGRLWLPLKITCNKQQCFLQSSTSWLVSNICWCSMSWLSVQVWKVNLHVAREKYKSIGSYHAALARCLLSFLQWL